MKLSEIEELRGHWKMESDPDSDDDGCACDYHTEGLRLLEERRRLYEALDALLGAKNPDSLEMAREALAFAEGPT